MGMSFTKGLLWLLGMASVNPIYNGALKVWLGHAIKFNFITFKCDSDTETCTLIAVENPT